MSVTVVVGGQYGSEGKGKVTHFWVKRNNADIVIRVGGSNSGHTVVDNYGKTVVLRQLPTAAILEDVYCILPAGSYIDVKILLKELELTKLTPEKLIIDPNAMIISENDLINEKNSDLRNNIGSTLSGTGAAVMRRIRRNNNILAKDDVTLKRFVKPVIPFLREKLDKGHKAVIEGTQGFGLSLLHSPHYPYVTSRDTTASGFVTEVGLNPLDITEIVLVLRTYPIRVAGNSGPLKNEIDWETLTKESKSDKDIVEYTSVTKLKRRVGRFDPEIVKQAIMYNRPTHLVLNHLDYIDSDCHKYNNLTQKVVNSITSIENKIDNTIDFVGFSPSNIQERK